MRKKYIILILGIILSSCSSSNFAKKTKSNSKRLKYNYKEITENVEVNNQREVNSIKKFGIKKLEQNNFFVDFNKVKLKKEYKEFYTENINSISKEVEKTQVQHFIKNTINKKELNEKPRSEKKIKVLGIISFVLAIIGLVLFWTYYGIFFTLPALIIGVIARKSIYGKIGLIISIVGLILTLIFWTLVILLAFIILATI